MKFWQAISFAEPDQLVGIAQAAEEAGYHGLLLADHLFFPGTLASKYPYSGDGAPMFDGRTPFPDPWTTIAAMAAATKRLHFATFVFILPLREPIQLAKTLGTLALLTDGRVALGAGAGWIREEFDALGIDFHTRGRRMDEMVALMRKLWTGDVVEHHGRFFDLQPAQMSPAPGREVPIWFGGLTDVAMKRATYVGDGWLGVGNTPEEAEQILGKLRVMRAQSARASNPFETIVPLVTPLEAPTLRRLEEHGMTGANSFPFSFTLGPRSTLVQKRDQMLRFGETVIAQTNR
ncbi:MAG: TIGR03619 family F420-dependent LLM class oxidoreductase [Deltaproteobacteria bacterium]|nr:TIGR03619 family F420-dependent LLM class oxidoreductase [Deltaproteobacteria bacterium]